MVNLKSLIAASVLVLASAPNLEAEKLVIMHTNDTHSHIDPVADDGMGGVARRKVLIDSVRAEHPGHTLLVDAGDVVQGTLFFNIYKGELEEKLMNALGYDIRILGNHEFDNGMEALAQNLMNSNAELLASNYQTIGTPLEGLFMPYTIHQFDGKRIAFIPVNLNPAGMIAANHTEGMGYLDAFDTANRMAWYVKNIEQADLVVALTHIGYVESNEPDDSELVPLTRDIDVIIGGHSHTAINPESERSVPHLLKNADGRDVLLAQAGSCGKYLGEITIDLDNISATPKSRLIAVDSRLDSRIDPKIEAIIAPYRENVNHLNKKVVTKVNRFMERDDTELLNFATDFVAHRGSQLANGVDFAILNKGGLRHSLPKGDITEGELITLMPFFNKIQVVDVKGSNIAEVFDIMTHTNGNGVSEGVEIKYDPQLKKCTSVIIHGKPIDPERIYRVATLDYLADGGDYMTPLKDHKLVAGSENLFYEDFLDYMTTGAGKGKPISGSNKKRMSPN